MSVFQRFVLMIWLLAAPIAVFAQDPKCPIPGDWKFVPEFSDEFNGSKLDPGKWDPFNPSWKGRAPGWFSRENVAVKDGSLQLTARVEHVPNIPKRYHTFTTAAVKSKERVCYGYFEVRFRPMNSKASSSFWFYASDQDLWTEIDVFELCGAHPSMGSTFYMNVHVFITPEDGKKHWNKGSEWVAPYRFADDYHVAGLLWTKDKIEWFVDGVSRFSLKNTHWHQKLNVNFDSETMPKWFGLPEPAELPSTFYIDYIRCWKTR
ncbi:MAG: family 16 glycosylhydrolase [Planctomycetia bacterium]|nr:family 16 glycosylhydrolase [Planctomycetia bacterium]